MPPRTPKKNGTRYHNGFGPSIASSILSFDSLAPVSGRSGNSGEVASIFLLLSYNLHGVAPLYLSLLRQSDKLPKNAHVPQVSSVFLFDFSFGCVTRVSTIYMSFHLALII